MSVSSPQARARRQSVDPLARTSVACTRCRRRKTKCLGTAPYPCMTCESVGAMCEYPRPDTLRVRVRDWNNLLARAQAAESVQSSDSPSSSLVADEAVNNEDDWRYNQETFFVTRSGEHFVLGAASSNYLAMQLSPESRSDSNFDMSPLHNADLYRREADSDLPKLPPPHTAKRWYMAQFAYIGSIFSFIQPKYFDSRFSEVYNRSPDLTNREDCLLYCQIYLLAAFGQCYSLNEWTSNEGPPGFQYFQAALKLLPDIHEEGSILFVEVLGLLSYFLQILNRRDAAFLYIGLAVRMAVSLGMHQEATNSMMDEVELEHRRRVWWSTYSMDRILCVKSGNPISIHDGDIDARWPSPLEELDLNPVVPTILAHYTQLSRILGKIGQDIYRKQHKSGTTLLASVQSIMEDLDKWRQAIPQQLILEASSFQYNVARENISIFLHYYQCVIMTCRPLLYRICKKRLEELAAGTAPATWQRGLSPSVIHIINHSLTAARDATTAMDAASRQNLFATYGFMDGEHAFSAALVLVMANVAFPYNDQDQQSMEQALTVLKGMANKGNEYIQARYALLLNLRTTLSRKTISGLPIDAQKHAASGEKVTDGQKMGHADSTTGYTSTSYISQQLPEFPFDLSMEDTEALFNSFAEDAQREIDQELIEGFLEQHTE